jgi:hypothetical protein
VSARSSRPRAITHQAECNRVAIVQVTDQDAAELVSSRERSDDQVEGRRRNAHAYVPRALGHRGVTICEAARMRAASSWRR